MAATETMSVSLCGKKFYGVKLDQILICSEEIKIWVLRCVNV